MDSFLSSLRFATVRIICFLFQGADGFMNSQYIGDNSEQHKNPIDINNDPEVKVL